MVTGISGSSQLLSALYSRQANQQKPPGPEEKFAALDADQSGVLETSEIVTLTEEVSSITGTEVDALTYDADADGSLSRSEVDAMMQALVINGPPSAPPPGFYQQAVSSYQTNQTSDPFTRVLEQMSARPMPEPPPTPDEKFTELDTDESGTLNQEELTEFVEEIASTTGQEVSISSYDQDEDGELNQDELDAMMSEVMAQFGPPPNMPEGGSMRDALVSYLENADEDTITDLLELISGYASNISTDADTSSVDVDV